jgi:CO dehydrogenase/acetyl-CoA synthase alpha subunit
MIMDELAGHEVAYSAIKSSEKQTNADKIRSMNDEELAEFLSENTNCDCCNIQCVDKLNCPSMSSCLFRFKEWLQSEVENDK